MKNNMKCVKFKEMIMEKVDGFADAGVLGIVDGHTKDCPECMAYEKSLKSMIQLTSLMKVEAPDFLETRIMASINAKTAKFNWFSALSYGSTFAVALIAAVFFLYYKASMPAIQTAVKPVPVVVADQPQTAVIHKIAAKPVVQVQVASVNQVIKQDLIQIPEKSRALPIVAAAKSIQPVSAEPAAETAAVDSPGKGEKVSASVEKSSVTLASVPAAETNPNYGVSSVALNSGVNAAKVTPVPTQPGLPLLDQNKAIIANNLINPNHGDGARIVIKVEETSIVKILVYDRAGRVVANILNEEKSPGNYEAYWYGKNDSAQTVSSGAYFVYIQIGQRVIKGHIIVNKN